MKLRPTIWQPNAFKPMHPPQPDTLEQATLLYHERKFSDAYHIASNLLKSEPYNAFVLNFAGACCYATDNIKDAERYWKTAIDIQPTWIDSHNNLGTLYWKKMRQPDSAEKFFRTALSIDNHRKDVQDNLIECLIDFRKFPDAIELCRFAMIDRPTDSGLAHNLGMALHQLDRLEEAEYFYKLALENNPRHHFASSNLGVIFRELRRYDEAEQAYRNAIAICPDEPLHHINLGALLIETGRWKEGWECVEWRHRRISDEFVHNLISTKIKRWHGEALQHKSLLIMPEQGFGDQIQMVRYIAAVKKLGAEHITLACSPELRTLFRSVPGADDVTTPTKAIKRRHYDFWISIFSLPHLISATSDAVPNTIPYIFAPKKSIDKWKKIVPRDTMQIGLVWRGSPHHESDAFRSLPSLSTLAPIWEIKGISYISLQRGTASEEITRLREKQPLRDLGEEIEDFGDTAAIITQLDLVITVDTSMAHLCGALGVPCWMLLSAIRTDWRWTGFSETSIWYPHKLKIYRQIQRGDWRSVVDNVTRDLEIFKNSHDAEPDH
ncbi:putative TPR repeat protein [Burkholderia lata]|uniref:tetratricopeptide repeat-containing glycosyltransferase family protein n=1 Tax=Burkholderia lata (strain ATCC 17760 / DSM 23089 / LMG 22485 / NCIMB 9086 / R18194 / 383) TaxID=482957 RepID=UPI0014543605|nr:tetratricopeptide repeat-containing glycosyltransferase family protein [Burkholderia lata]VWB78818.1 putative TPR repeat protein [Burkholderia lata]